jgi:hypothetical protein
MASQLLTKIVDTLFLMLLVDQIHQFTWVINHVE